MRRGVLLCCAGWRRELTGGAGYGRLCFLWREAHPFPECSHVCPICQWLLAVFDSYCTTIYLHWVGVNIHCSLKSDIGKIDWKHTAFKGQQPHWDFKKDL
jgi:hypothetical protein